MAGSLYVASEWRLYIKNIKTGLESWDLQFLLPNSGEGRGTDS
jgi:hypothetical protein